MNIQKKFLLALVVSGLAMALMISTGHSADGDASVPPPRPTLGGRTNMIWIHSQPGANEWNAGKAPEDWWAEIKRQHGHVGPWNVLGWRIAQKALYDLKSDWGAHELEILCYVPPQTPFSCLADGLSVGSGNTLGRLDLRLAEVMDYRQSFVSIRRKDGKGDILEFRPVVAYLKSITNQPLDALERLSRECSEKPEEDIFTIRRLPQ